MARTILVSGAGSGIGRAVAQRLGSAGHQVLLLGRTESALQETRALLPDPDTHLTAVANVCDPQSIREALIKTEITRLHGVVANAGVGGENHYGPEDRWGEIINTNLSGVYYLINEALPYLRLERKEDFRHIVLISSVLARLGVPGYTAYCASKAGLLGLMRVWAQTFAAENILVNALCPGWVDTEMAREGLDAFAHASGVSFEEALAEQMSMVPLGKMSKPVEIGELVYFLLCGAQSSITGQALDINNGAIMP